MNRLIDELDFLFNFELKKSGNLADENEDIRWSYMYWCDSIVERTTYGSSLKLCKWHAERTYDSGDTIKIVAKNGVLRCYKHNILVNEYSLDPHERKKKLYPIVNSTCQNFRFQIIPQE